MTAPLFAPRAIGHARTPFADKDDVPKGPLAVHDADGVLEIDPAFAEGLDDIDGFSHLIVLWFFDRAKGFELKATPPGSRVAHGVFSTRSPYRPNPIAVTVVELLRRDGNRLQVRGMDMADGTPLLDIKPYLSNVTGELKLGWIPDFVREQQQRA